MVLDIKAAQTLVGIKGFIFQKLVFAYESFCSFYLGSIGRKHNDKRMFQIFNAFRISSNNNIDWELFCNLVVWKYFVKILGKNCIGCKIVAVHVTAVSQKNNSFTNIFLRFWAQIKNLWKLKFSILKSVFVTKCSGFYLSWKFIPSILQILVARFLSLNSLISNTSLLQLKNYQLRKKFLQQDDSFAQIKKWKIV